MARTPEDRTDADALAQERAAENAGTRSEEQDDAYIAWLLTPLDLV